MTKKFLISYVYAVYSRDGSRLVAEGHGSKVVA